MELTFLNIKYIHTNIVQIIINEIMKIMHIFLFGFQSCQL